MAMPAKAADGKGLGSTGQARWLPPISAGGRGHDLGRPIGHGMVKKEKKLP
jgi:hypothetical protein